MADSSYNTWRLSKVGFGVPGINLYLGSMLSESFDRHGFKALLRTQRYDPYTWLIPVKLFTSAWKN